MTARPCDDGGVDAEVRHLPVGRILAIDDRGTGLRATWHLDRGFINLSLWRGDRCSETFHLTPADAAKLVSFLVTGMAEAAEVASTPTAPPESMPSRWTRLRRAIGERLTA